MEKGVQIRVASARPAFLEGKGWRNMGNVLLTLSFYLFLYVFAVFISSVLNIKTG